MNMPRYFDEDIYLGESGLQSLPFFHSCEAFFFKLILKDKKIAPTECPVFKNEKLLYLFYGRPAYKISTGESSGLNSLLPITFIFNGDSIGDIKRIAPFDTGGFFRGLYKDYMHPKMNLDEYFLTPQKRVIPSFVNHFFSTNENYFKGIPREKVEFDAMDFQVECYYQLIKTAAKQNADDRKASIEVQLDHEIGLTEDAIEAVIIPDIFMASKLVRDFVVDELKAKILTYECYGVPSDHYYVQVLAIAKKYLSEGNYFNEQR